MLVLSRKIEEGLCIGDTIEIKVLDVFASDKSGSRKSKVASIGIDAPREVTILRGELKQTLQENIEASGSTRDLAGLGGLAGMLRKKRTLEKSED